MRTLGINGYDVCIVTIGSDFQSSLETTSLLKELGGKLVVSRADRDVQAKFLLRNGAEELRLTSMEFKLLCLQAKNTGKVLTHTIITQNIWGRSWDNDVASLRVFMTTLRKKIEPGEGSPKYIQTHIGIGYRVLKAD